MSHVDEFVDELLRDDRVCDVILPRVQKRHILEELDELEPRVGTYSVYRWLCIIHCR